VVRRSVDVLAAELPYVTLLLRVRGNTGAERWALERRREFDRRLAGWCRTRSTPVTCARPRPPARDPAAVRRRQQRHRVVPPGRRTGLQQVSDTLVALCSRGCAPEGDGRTTTEGTTRMLLEHRIGGRWVRPDDDGAPLLDAVTGDQVARFSTAPVPAARRCGTPARPAGRRSARCRSASAPRRSSSWALC
jgi:hypothetical protein